MALFNRISISVHFFYLKSEQLTALNTTKQHYTFLSNILSRNAKLVIEYDKF